MTYRSRVVIFDVLRGIAIILVLGRHMAVPDAAVSGPLKHIAGWWIQLGWIGVDLFFVLSGFLVSGLLFSECQRHGSLHIGRFLVRRAFKIYPGFYFMILVTVALAVMTDTFDASMAAALVPELLYIQNYLPGVWNHTWSLAVEEHFYVLLAICLAMLVRRQAHLPEGDPFRKFVGLAIFTVLAIAAGRLLAPYGALYTGRYIDPTQLRYETHVRIDTLIVGVVLSYLYHFHRSRFTRTVVTHRTLIMIASAVLLTPPLLWPLGQSPWMPSVGLLSIALGFGGVLVAGLASAESDQQRDLRMRPLTAMFAFVGFHSYSVYLWHLPVQTILMPYLGRTLLPPVAFPDLSFLINTSAYFIASVFVGVLIGKLLEQPALALRDRLFPTRTGDLSMPSQPRDQERPIPALVPVPGADAEPQAVADRL
jgi:peptidoglycan/LPS O-acetylase OafA/YrhL